MVLLKMLVRVGSVLGVAAVVAALVGCDPVP
jgi:hypothetical protein